MWTPILFFPHCSKCAPITGTERSTAYTVFVHSEAGIVGSNSAQGTDVWCLCMCVFSVCVQVEALLRANHQPKEVLSNV
jgi:hypothetical protein